MEPAQKVPKPRGQRRGQRPSPLHSPGHQPSKAGLILAPLQPPRGPPGLLYPSLTLRKPTGDLRAPQSSSSTHPVTPVPRTTAPARDKSGHVCPPQGQPGQGWVGGGGGKAGQPGRTGRSFQPYSNPVSPLALPTSGSTPTNQLPPPHTHTHNTHPFTQVLNTRYGLTC